MSDSGKKRLSKLASELNVGISTIVEFLQKKGLNIDTNPNNKVEVEYVDLLYKQYKADLNLKKETEKISELRKTKKKNVSLRASDEDDEEFEEDEEEFEDEKESNEKVLLIKDRTNNISDDKKIEKPKEVKKEEVFTEEKSVIEGPKILGKIELEEPKKEEKIIEDVVPEVVMEIITEVQNNNDAIIDVEPIKEENIETLEKTFEKKDKKVAEKKEVVLLKKEEAEKQPLVPEKKKLVLRKKGDADYQSNQQNQKPEHKKHFLDKKDHKKEDKRDDKNAGNKIRVVEPTEIFRTKIDQLSGPTVVGKIELSDFENRKEQEKRNKKKKRKRIKKDAVNIEGFNDSPKKLVKFHEKEMEEKPAKDHKKDKKQVVIKDAGSDKNLKQVKKKLVKQDPLLKQDVSDEDVFKKVKETLARLQSKGKTKSSKFRRQKRDNIEKKHQEELLKQEEDRKILRITEFIPVSELAHLMDVQVNEVISACMSLGAMVSINQRLEADLLQLVAEEFDFKVEFISVDAKDDVHNEVDKEEDMRPRPPIVTVMGHVDHGKTSFLDYLRKTNVIAGEAGGITQHIGAYRVSLPNSKEITFLDTPGHEAFTAMRARGTQVTDIAIIVIAADDSIMPQTNEAISHAQAAGVPIIFAITKVDKPSANPDKIKEQLAAKNLLIEEWGGKYGSADISSKTGKGIDELLERILLEAEMLELKANPSRKAIGTVIESALDKGRGYVATVLVSTGNLKNGDVILAGQYHGKVKAMFNERGQKVAEAGPSHPVLILGLNGAPGAGDKFNALEDERDAREIAAKREQIIRELGQRSSRHITLDEIGRRIAVGNFKELNVIIKGDVDGSIEALADSLIKLSTEEIQVNVIHKAVGQIAESDVNLASASDAVIIGFQVRPSSAARRLAEKEGIEIRLYSIIYDAIEELKSAMEGMLSPEIREEIIGSMDVRETFKITKVGTVAGCLVTEGKVLRDAKVRIIRDGIVIYTGNLGSLKRYKDDVKEVRSGTECGLNIDRYNDIKVGDTIEAFQEFEVKKKL
jgi:translation initiation factor IF-2